MRGQGESIVEFWRALHNAKSATPCRAAHLLRSADTNEPTGRPSPTRMMGD